MAGRKVARLKVGSYEFETKGISRFDLRDPYHLAIALSWPQFFLALLGLFVAVNLVFAALFWLAPDSVAHAGPGSFGDMFFFSMETLSTIGYGDMYPATVYGRVVVGVEVVCGLAFTAILTGLTFVRFSRPRAQMVFAAHPVVARYKERPTLMVRVGNGRAALLTDAAAKLIVLLSARTAEGKLFREAHVLRLERAGIPAFPLSWTIMHVLDERSPLFGYDAARAGAADLRLFVTVEARDPALSTTMQQIRNYGPADLRFGMRYADAVSVTEDGMLALDLAKIGALEPDVGAEWREQGWTEQEDAASAPPSD
jgi:inward rectifier potassium channel